MINYDLEQQIMRCWSICDDIQDLRKMRDSRAMSEDEIDNYLLGLVSLYQVKFENLFSIYEQMLREQAAQKNPALGP